MRGTPWLAGLVCVLLVLVPTAVFSAAQDEAPRDTRSSDAPYAGELREWSGRSVLHFKGACAHERAACIYDATREDGTFFLPSPAQGGSVVISWSPVDESLRVLRATIAGLEVTGESPLRLDLIGLVAGEHAVGVEPAGRIVGSYDQSVDWVATFSLSPAAESIDTRGITAYETRVACIVGTCDPLTSVDSDRFVVPWDARGSLVADWDPGDGAMRLAIPGTSFVAEGDPPLALALDGLTAGDWSVDARPALAKAALADVSVRWHVVLEPAG